MTSDAITPQQWLADSQLQPGEQLFAVISSTSAANPLAAYRQHGIQLPVALWAGTPYADWLPVMPYLLTLQSDSKFFQWVAETDADDWGWLAISNAAPASIAEHLRSLTQVLMPDGAAVFFRYWDGRHTLPLLQQLGAEAREVLPIFDRYWINDHTVRPGQGAIKPALPYPWWEVPQGLLASLTENAPGTLIDNLLHQLHVSHPELYASLPEPSLRQKVGHFVQRTPSSQLDDISLLLAHVQQGAYP